MDNKMIPATEAHNLASNFAKTKMGLSGVYCFDVKPAEDFTDYCYFDLVIIILDEQLFGGSRIAGPRGILVNKVSGNPQTVSFGKFAELTQTEKHINELFQLLSNLTENGPTWDKLKKDYHLDSNGLEIKRSQG